MLVLQSSSVSWGGSPPSLSKDGEKVGGHSPGGFSAKQGGFPALPFVLPLVAVFDGKETTRGSFGMVVSKYTTSVNLFSERKGSCSSSSSTSSVPGLSIVALDDDSTGNREGGGEEATAERSRGEGGDRRLRKGPLLKCMPLSQVKKVSRVLEYGRRKRPTTDDGRVSKTDIPNDVSQKAGGAGAAGGGETDNTSNGGEQELSFSVYVYRVYFKHPVPVWEETPSEAKTKWVTVAVEEEALRRQDVNSPEACDRLLLSVLKGSAETLKTGGL